MEDPPKTQSAFRHVRKKYISNDRKSINLHHFSVTKEISVLNLYKFMKKHGNVYVPLPGCDVALDKLVHRFMVELTNRPEVRKSAEDYISKITCDKVLTVFKWFFDGFNNYAHLKANT